MRKISLMKKCGWFLGCFFAVAGMTACTDDENKVEDFVPGEGFSETMTLLPGKGSQTMKFTANSNWTARSSQTWLKLDGQDQTNGKAGAAEVYVSFDTNELVTDRTADITLSVGSTLKTIKVTQKAAGRVIAFDGVAGDTLNMKKDLMEYEAAILANVAWEFVADSLPVADKAWIEVTPKDGKVAIKILNQDGLARTARLVFRDKNFPAFTKALFVAVGGWGETYLTWTIDEKMFTEKADSAMIAASFVADVEPRALVIRGNDTLAEQANWISFSQLPASKSAMQEKKWRMTVADYNDVEDRMALVVLVPSSMTDGEVKAQLKSLKSEKILQSNNLPAIKYGIWRYDQKKDPVTGAVIEDDKGHPVYDYVWENYYTESVEFKLMETKVAIQIFSNRKVDNLRFVKLNADGTESVLDYDSPWGNGYVKGTFRDVNHTMVDATMVMKVYSAGVGGRLSNWMALDLLDENGSKIKTVYFELVQTTNML